MTRAARVNLRPRLRPRRPRRGFAGLMAIFLLLLVASTLVVLGWAAVVEARRSRSQQDEAQLRQLLTAGAATAARDLNAVDVPTGQRQVALPAELNTAGASLTLTFSAPTTDRAQVEVVAALPRRTSRQTLEFTRAAGRWSIASATLGLPTTPATFPAATQQPATTGPSTRAVVR